MGTLTKTEYDEYSKRSIYNKKALGKSPFAACYACLKVFFSIEICEWVDGNSTAVCPMCEVDCVVTFDFGKEDKERSLLREAHELAFKKKD